MLRLCLSVNFGDVIQKQAVDTLDKISSIIPTEVAVIKDGVVEFITVDGVVVGDVIEMRAGNVAALDGELISGEGEALTESTLSSGGGACIKRA